MERRQFLKHSFMVAAASAVIPEFITACQKNESVKTACGIPVDRVWFREQSMIEVASHDQLLSLNLVSWPDSLLGFCKHPVSGDYYGFGFGDLGDIMRARFSVDGTSILEGIRVPMRDINDNWTGSGGPVYYHAATGMLLMVTHHEKYVPSDPTFFAHVTLRMAKSLDFGETWTNLGLIIDHNATDETDPNKALVMGNGGFILKNEGGIEYMYVYHQDMQATGVKNQLAVSRASVEDIVQAAQNNIAPTFHKWDGNGWIEPGIGGKSVDLMPDYTTWGVVGDFDPFYCEELGKYVAFYPSQIRGDVNPPTWNVLSVISNDAIHWKPATKVYQQDISGHDPIYTGVEAHNRVIKGCDVKLYRMYVTDTSSRWEFNKLDLVYMKMEELP